jgi:riboflavin kinase/FMN adenylyltransferase
VVVKVVRGLPEAWGLESRPRAVTIGVYDGVHRGHRHVLATLRRRAGDLGGIEPAVVTFDPHPLALIAPGKAPRMLTTVEHRIALLEEAGIDLVAVLEFSPSVRDLSPAGFAVRVVDEALSARVVVVGEDFRFGKDRTGHVGLLRELGAEHGFETEIVPLVGGAGPVSSTHIRALVAAGDVASAAEVLGRPHEVRGLVVPGDGRGRSIGVPTANIAVPDGVAVPGRGVYAVLAAPAGEPLVPGVANVGVRPTFGGGVETVEVHLLDEDRDLYGLQVRLAFVERIRDERRFAGVEELVAQIAEDIRQARNLLASSG